MKHICKCIADAFLQRRHIGELLPEDEEERVGEVHVADEVGQVGDDGHVVPRRARQRITIYILAPWGTQDNKIYLFKQIYRVTVVVWPKL